jgi:hypothetical protein
VAEANTENSRFAPERTFCPLHRFGDLRDWCSSFRMRFEFLVVDLLGGVRKLEGAFSVAC